MAAMSKKSQGLLSALKSAESYIMECCQDDDAPRAAVEIDGKLYSETAAAVIMEIRAALTNTTPRR